MKLRSAVHAVFVLLFVLLLADCSGHKQTDAKVPPPPAVESTPVPGTSASSQPLPGNEVPLTEKGEKEKDALSFPADAKPILVDTGLASWYGAPYHNRHGSNGKIYDMNAMTAAHRTLPLGSIVRVTNVKTGHSAIVRITDRGPFIEGRILDLSLAAAKKVDVWQPGIAAVRMEVLRAPVPLTQGGRWAVQIGAFADSESAQAMKEKLMRRYRSAKVLEFAGPRDDWWVRVRVLNDDKARAEEVARENHTDEGGIYLVRLD